MSGNAPLTVMLVAGEPSGDALGAQLMSALRRRTPRELRFVGLGGSAMAAEGLVPLFPLRDVAVMGLMQVGRHLPLILRRIRELVAFAAQTDPDIVVLIDSGDLNYRVARGMKAAGVTAPIVKYVSPQVWASRQGRVKKIGAVFDHVLTLLPFEPAFYERAGVPATHVGHPVLERDILRGAGPDFRTRHGLAPDQPLVTVLPGSRSSETRKLLPVFAETLVAAKRAVPDCAFVVPTVAHLADEVRAAVASWPQPLHMVESEADKYAAFEASTAALAASGTVSLELAVAKVPMVIGYRLGWLTGAIARRLVKVRYITLINLILDREAVPEFVLERCTADLMAPAVVRLLTDAQARRAQQAAFAEALAALGVEGGSPSERAADAILRLARG